MPGISLNNFDTLQPAYFASHFRPSSHSVFVFFSAILSRDEATLRKAGTGRDAGKIIDPTPRI